MAVPTALITFRIRAPPSARTVQLYGSWDNFTRAYAMQHDHRISPEHWTGCHTFSNIICDGDPSTVRKPRSGGLKMGGTYWYYYKIDDDIDFHNTSEPSTTSCPMLPGQLVNVLNIPYAFSSSSRSRNASTSSTERMTMDPKDKFMRPRPAPARPVALHVTTSPKLTSEDYSKSATPSSPFTPHSTRDNASSSRFAKLSRKTSYDTFIPKSDRGKSAGVRNAFQVRPARSQSPRARAVFLDPYRVHNTRATSAEREHKSPGTTPVAERSRPPQRGLLFRSASDDTIPTTSFLQGRRQRSVSRETPRLNQAPVPEDVITRPGVPVSQLLQPPLTTLKEVLSASNTPISETPQFCDNDASQLNLEKRLPTLPNTPSSAYPVSLRDDSPLRKKSLDIEGLQSHFSTTTIDTTPNIASVLITKERSYFSNWTIGSDAGSPTLEILSGPGTHQQDGPALHEESHDEEAQELCLPPAFSNLSISSTVSTTPSTSYFDTDVDLADSPICEADRQLQIYSLPEAQKLPLVTKNFTPFEPELLDHKAARNTTSQNTTIIHSDSMQKLLDELSYLSDMIQQ